MKNQSLSGIQLEAEPFHRHASRCSKDPVTCLPCGAAMRFFNSQPLATLSKMLADVVTPKLRIPAGIVFVDRFIDRHNHVSKRRDADVLATAEILAAYQAAGGVIA